MFYFAFYIVLMCISYLLDITVYVRMGVLESSLKITR